MRFTTFLYKIADQVRYEEDQKLYRQDLRKAGKVRQRIKTSIVPRFDVSEPTLIDLTEDGHDTSAHMRSVTPTTSVCSSRPTSSHMSVSQGSLSGAWNSDVNSVDASRRPSLTPSTAASVALPPYRSPAVSTPVLTHKWNTEANIWT